LFPGAYLNRLQCRWFIVAENSAVEEYTMKVSSEIKPTSKTSYFFKKLDG
jgi:hypothetical protein